MNRSIERTWLGVGGLGGLGVVGVVGALLAASMAGAESASQPADVELGAYHNAVIITMIGEINDVTLRSLNDRLDVAKRDHNADLIFLEIDTYGGLLKSALAITARIREHDTKIVAYVNTKAISAGAMIAVACDEIVMEAGSTIGDCAPIMMGQKLEGTEREKVESPTRTEFRNSAERNGHNKLLAMAMVTDRIAVYKIARKDSPETVKYVDDNELRRLTGVRMDPDVGLVMPGDGKSSDEDKDTRAYEWVFERTVVSEGELLTMTAQEAVEYGFAKGIVRGRGDLAARYGLSEVPPVLGHNWSQKLAAFLASMEVRSILMILLIVGVYLELNSPGIGAPAALAAVCLCLVLGAPYLTGLANMWEILLILSGVALLIIEVFVIPGFGVAGVGGIILILAGLMLTFVQEPIEPKPIPWPSWEMFAAGIQDGLVSLFVALVGSITVCVVLAKYFHRVPILRTLQLSDGISVLTAEEKAGGAFGGPPLGGSIQFKIGSAGVTESPLRPAGKARFGRELVDVVAEAQFVENHVPIEVVQVLGNRIVVRPGNSG